MNKFKLKDAQMRSEDNWSEFLGGNDYDIARKNGVQSEKEHFFIMTQKELDECIMIKDRVLICIDEMTEYSSGSLKLVMPESISDDQFDTFHKPVSGVVYKQCGGLPKGMRVFFHYLCIVEAKLRANSQSGIFVQCDKKGYLIIERKHLYVGIIDSLPVSLHPDFCITEAVERQDEFVEAEDGFKFLAKKTDSGLYIGEELLNTKTYEPFICKVVSLPDKKGMDAHRLEAFEKTKVVDGETVLGAILQEGDKVKCRKSWDIPLQNGVQKFFGDRKLFRTRITAIQEIL